MAAREVPFKSVANVLLGDDLKNEKCPLVMDPSGNVVTFLKYRDVNLLDASSSALMSPEPIRKALIGSLRYGKPLVVDMGQADLFENCVKQFDAVEAGLMASVLDKSIIQEEKYSKLIRESDGSEYKLYEFREDLLNGFKFIMVTGCMDPSASSRGASCAIQVVM